MYINALISALVINSSPINDATFDLAQEDTRTYAPTFYNNNYDYADPEEVKKYLEQQKAAPADDKFYRQFY